MEFVDGQPLSGLIPPRGLPHDDLVRYGTQVADAIADAHDRGVVHCDLKPQNIVTEAQRALDVDPLSPPISYFLGRCSPTGGPVGGSD